MNVIIFMNCMNQEIRKYLNEIPEFTNIYNIKAISTYSNLNNPDILSEFNNCDILICNVIKNYPIFNFENIKKYLKPDTRIIKCEFFRFSGFWPIGYKDNFINAYDKSYEETNNIDEFNNYIIDKELILNKFNESLLLLKELDDNSDIKIYEYFINNYKNIPMFRDNWHPSKYIIKHIIKQIINLLEINTKIDIDLMNVEYDFGFMFRYRMILPCVKKVLDIKYDDNIISFFNKNINKEQFYKYVKLTDGINNYEQSYKIFMDLINN